MEQIAETATKKAERAGELRALRPGTHVVVLEPAAVASLLEFLAMTAGAEDMQAGRSFLAGRLGQKIAGDGINIYDDHAHPLHRGIPFDVEGIAKKKVSIIERGTATQAVYSLRSARAYGAEPTGHGTFGSVFDEGERASNIVMSGGEGSAKELIGSMSAGLAVTRFWYTRMVDPRSLTITGLTRDGTFLVESGEIVAPVRNMRFNVSVLDFLANVEAMSQPVWAHGLVVPGVRATGFRFSGGIES
jgi:predicted Zn-dependent protease